MPKLYFEIKVLLKSISIKAFEPSSKLSLEVKFQLFSWLEFGFSLSSFVPDRPANDSSPNTKKDRSYYPKLFFNEFGRIETNKEEKNTKSDI